MKVFKNGQEIFLDKNDFIASGGEGSIYVKNGEVFKIYDKPIIQDFIKKINELSVLDKSNILKPLFPLFNKANSLVGFTMRYVDNTASLPLLFTTTFRERNGITPDKTVKLVERMAEVIQYIHEKKILIVDANEFNYLVAKSDLITPYFIDVDSYQTPSFPATVIFPSIRDFTNKSFDELTDWYSFGVVAMQLFVGIHPYKGTHALYKKDDIESRCKNHISVFNASVRTPPSVRPFDLIPNNYKRWFFEVYEQGKRIVPPTVSGTITVKAQETIVSNKLIITFVLEFPEKITKVKWIGGNRIVQGKHLALLGNSKVTVNAFNSDYIFHQGFHKISIINNQLTVDEKDTGIQATKHFIIDNRIYVLDNDNLREIELAEIGVKTFSTVKNSWNILPNASVTYKNCIYSNVFGKSYFYIPFDEGKCQIIDIKLDNVRIMDASYEKQTLYVVFAEKGTYNRAIYKFDKNINIVDSAIERDIDLNEINTTSLNSGVNILLADNNLNLTTLLKTEKKVVDGVGLPTDASLTSDGSAVYYFSENKLFTAKMS